MAQLFLGKDGSSGVSHVDLADPERIYYPEHDFSHGFASAMKPYSASILAPELRSREGELFHCLHAVGIEDALPV
ncbi:MAG: hypothetical protein U0175_31155 [Caldilineaceae bacterium]